MVGDSRGGLVDRLTAILEEAGIFITAELDGSSIKLSGEVDSAQDRQAAIDVAAALGANAGITIENAIAILDVDGSDMNEDGGPLIFTDAPFAEVELNASSERL